MTSKNIITDDHSLFIWFHRIIDAFSPLLLIYVVTFIYEPSIWNTDYFTFGLIAGLLYSLTLQFSDIYSSWQNRAFAKSIEKIIYSTLFTWFSLILLLFLLKDSAQYSRMILISCAGLLPLFSLSYRFAIKYAVTKIIKTTTINRKIAIFGAGDLGKHLADKLLQNPWLGIQPVAFYDDNPELNQTQYKNVLIKTPDIEIIDSNDIQEIYICLPMKADKRIKEILNQLTQNSIVVKYVPDLFAYELMHSKLTSIQGIPVFSIYDTPLNSLFYRLLKKLEDLLLSIIILILISPLCLIIALTIKATSKGPILYKQRRVGWNGKTFNIYKFRSMAPEQENVNVEWGNADKKQVTKVGQFLRKTSLDELPQFLNVLIGNMSIVGPRPERDIFVEQFKTQIPRYMQKHMVKAGITGWAQVNGLRGDTSLEKRLEYDLHYINHWSIWLDLKIILLTIFNTLHNN